MNRQRLIDVLLRSWTPRVSGAFLEAIANIRKRINTSLLERLIKSKDVSAAVDSVRISERDFTALDLALTAAFNDGGSKIADTIPPTTGPNGGTLHVVFDARNPTAERIARTMTGDLIREIVDDQREVIRQHIEAGIAAGQNPRTTALVLAGTINKSTGRREGGVIGLTRMQEQWQRNYAMEIASSNPSDLKKALDRALRDKRFDASIRKAIATGQPIPAATQARMRVAYRNNSLFYRAEVISRNETLKAMGLAQTETFRQAIERNEVEADTIIRKWLTAKDERVRHTHRLIPSMNKDGVGWDEPFKTPTGPSLHAPHDRDIMCRCRELINIDFAKAIFRKQAK